MTRGATPTTHYRQDDCRPEGGETLPLERFMVQGDTLVAEASDFGPLRDGRRWLRRLFNDACDVGVFVVSPTTGKVMRFYLEREEKDAEGDLVAYRLKVYERDAFVCPRIKSVTIFND